jgi:DNA-directed RNA polymerase subunit M/transcription elongation factor TFIIS
MEFCQKCDTRLINKHSNPYVLVCSRCGFENAVESSTPRPTVIRKSSAESIKVIDQDVAGLRVLPTIRADCPKCESKKAHSWAIFVSDEEETMMEVQVFKCTSCKYTWREKG